MTVSDAFASLTSALAAIPTLQGSSKATLAPALAAANTTLAEIETEISDNEPVFAVASPDGQMPQVAADWLTTSATTAVSQATLVTAQGYVGRIALNLTNGAT